MHPVGDVHGVGVRLFQEDHLDGLVVVHPCEDPLALAGVLDPREIPQVDFLPLGVVEDDVFQILGLREPAYGARHVFRAKADDAAPADLPVLFIQPLDDFINAEPHLLKPREVHHHLNFLPLPPHHLH